MRDFRRVRETCDGVARGAAINACQTLVVCGILPRPKDVSYSYCKNHAVINFQKIIQLKLAVIFSAFVFAPELWHVGAMILNLHVWPFSFCAKGCFYSSDASVPTLRHAPDRLHHKLLPQHTITMRLSGLLLAPLLALLSTVTGRSATGDRVLVVLEPSVVRDEYSRFWGSLKGQPSNLVSQPFWPSTLTSH